MFSLTNKRLQHIFNLELDDLIKSFEDLRKSVDARSFKYEVMISFWFAVHMDRFEAAKQLLDLDSRIQKVVVNIREAGKKVLKVRKMKL